MADKTGKFKKIAKRITKFAKEIKSELKKVIWPNRKQLTNNTITVVLACLVIGSIIWIADWILVAVVQNTLVK